jgi:RNA polymerase sigma-70 factor (ECF subfamily)
MTEPEPSRFEALVLPHLDAAYNLARWLTRDPHDAEDVVQEACVRALRYLATLRDREARAWFLTIVRHACYDWLGRNRGDAGDGGGRARGRARKRAAERAGRRDERARWCRRSPRWRCRTAR